MNCSELIDEVKDAIGRPTDTRQITDTRVLRWINKGQKEIAEKCPGLMALDFKNTSSVDFTASLSYPLSDFTSSLDDVTDSNRICHIYRAWYLDGGETQRLQFVPLAEFDEQYPDPTHSDSGTGKPKYYTRRGSNIEIFPIPSSSEYDKDFRLDGSVYPVDFTATTSTESSTLTDADEMLIAYGIFRAWSYIGGEAGKANALEWRGFFNAMLDEYQSRNDVLHEWDANIYGEW